MWGWLASLNRFEKETKRHCGVTRVSWQFGLWLAGGIHAGVVTLGLCVRFGYVLSSLCTCLLSLVHRLSLPFAYCVVAFTTMGMPMQYEKCHMYCP